MPSFPENKVYSVEEITSHIDRLIYNDEVLSSVNVKGEISDITFHHNGNIYFSIKDEKALIKCTMFGYIGSLDFEPQRGTSVLVSGRVTVYKPRGEYSIRVESMQLAGEGELYARFLKLKEKLQKEGLFNEERKKQIPLIPKKIGIITSIEGAAVRDVIKTVRKRFPHVSLIIYNSLVQGSTAKYQIEKGIKCMNKVNSDVIILARGGGSFEDLWSFNEENVVRAIAKSRVPIITGIGHETDFTLADFVADRRAHTPSAAAELAVPDIREVIALVQFQRQRLARGLARANEIYSQRLAHVKSRRVFLSPGVITEGARRTVISHKEKLSALSPKGILARGYSITLKGQQIIKSSRQLKVGEEIKTILSEGEVSSTVK